MGITRIIQEYLLHLIDTKLYQLLFKVNLKRYNFNKLSQVDFFTWTLNDYLSFFSVIENNVKAVVLFQV